MWSPLFSFFLTDADDTERWCEEQEMGGSPCFRSNFVGERHFCWEAKQLWSVSVGEYCRMWRCNLGCLFLGQVMLVMMSLLLWHLHHFHLDVRRRFLHLSLGPQLVGWLVCFQQGNTCSSLDSWCSSSSTSVWWTIKQLKFQFHVVDNLVFLLESKYRETNHWCPSIDCIIVCCCVAPK